MPATHRRPGRGHHGDRRQAPSEPPRLEHLDRGLVAASTSEGVFLSWRLLGDEVTGHGAKGMTGTDFRVYRDGRAIATVTDSTNYRDPSGTSRSRYQVAPIAKGREGRKSPVATPWLKNVL
ncbi:hypothetical protein GCM10020001_093320 [Nonomuraea salmonea]